MRHTLIPFLCMACSGSTEPAAPLDTAPPTPVPATDTDTTPVEPTGACGDVTQHDIVVKGMVHNEQGNPAPFADVWLEDRGWQPITNVGQSMTNSEGVYEFTIMGLTSVEDCWGTLLDYVMVGELGPQRGEDEINTWLFSAIENGTLVADMSSSPLTLEDTSTTP